MPQVFINDEFVQALINTSGRFERETEPEMLLCLPCQGGNVIVRPIPHKSLCPK